MTIYDTISRNSPGWLDNKGLANILDNGLRGFQSESVKPRTRSKEYKEKISEILGCEIPKSFKKTKPKFPVQNFDLYIQAQNNLQIWNDEVDLERRYVIIRVDDNAKYITLKVIDGKELIHLDTTGKLTSKLQAILKVKNIDSKLYSEEDTKNITQYLADTNSFSPQYLPSSLPVEQELLSISQIYDNLLGLVGMSFENIKSDRLRGDKVHILASKLLGYKTFSDNGQFPDIRNQLLEIKAQTSPTIDIGKENPICNQLKPYGELNFANEDIRYAIVYMEEGLEITTIKNIIIVNGKSFFDAFVPMNGENTKIQLPLPRGFFN